jgi:hypothetical protein
LTTSPDDVLTCADREEVGWMVTGISCLLFPGRPAR